MEACRDQEELLMRYLDQELDPEEQKKLEDHLKSCPGCSSFLAKNRSLDALLEHMVSPAQEGLENQDLLNAVKERLTQEGLSLSKEKPFPASARELSVFPFSKMWVAAASVAAAVLLFLLYVLTLEEDLPESRFSPDELVAQRDQVQKPGKIHPFEDSQEGVGLDEARKRSREELRSVLEKLSDTSDQDLLSRFEAAVSPLREKGWRVEHMLAGLMKRETGPALKTALRLAGQIPGFEKVYGVIPILSRYLEKDIYPEETLKALAILDGSRAENALGRALLNPSQQNLALHYLSGMEGEDPVHHIVQALLQGEEVSSVKITPFAAKGVAALGRMGLEGVEGILKVFKKTSYNPKVLQALSPLDPELEDTLSEGLSKWRGSLLDTGVRLCACLRVEEVLAYLGAQEGTVHLDEETPTLIALVGGSTAVSKLVSWYGEPISIKERKRVSMALAQVFELYPEETDTTLLKAMDFLSQEEKDLFIEMVSKAKTQAGCRALGWLIANQPELASQAALGLARIGTMDALDVILAILDKGGLDAGSRVAAGAAAFHLGGREVLDKLYQAEEIKEAQTPSGAYAQKKPRVPLHRRVLTDKRFEKLQEYITRFSGESTQ